MTGEGRVIAPFSLSLRAKRGNPGGDASMREGGGHCNDKGSEISLINMRASTSSLELKDVTKVIFHKNIGWMT